MNAQIAGFTGLTVIIIGIFMILTGLYMSIKDWNKNNFGNIELNKHSIDKTITSMTKFIIALEKYPTGQRIILLGILLIIIGGTIGSIGNFTSKC